MSRIGAYGNVSGKELPASNRVRPFTFRLFFKASIIGIGVNLGLFRIRAYSNVSGKELSASDRVRPFVFRLSFRASIVRIGLNFGLFELKYA